MDDTPFVGIVKGLAGHKDDFHNLADGLEVLNFAKCLEVGTVDILHGDVTEILIHPCVINGHDTGMHQPTGGLGFQKESFTIFVDLFTRDTCGRSRYLDTDVSVDIGVFTKINDPHAALAQFPDDLISPDCLDIGEIGKKLRINRVGLLIFSQELHFEPTGQALLLFPVL